MPEPETPLSERPWEDVDRLRSVDEVRQRVLAAVAPLPAVDVPLLAARGLVLAEPVIAAAAVPPFRNSAMDGYAVCAAETAGASSAAPVRLRLAGLQAAGSAILPTLQAGCAIRIMTGAPMPAGADAVVRFEETSEGEGAAPPVDGHDILVYRPARAGDNVREAGEDVALGAEVLPRGRRLRPADLGLLAALGWGRVRVHRRPRVAVLSTGDEVVEIDAPLRPGLIRDSNATMLAAMAAGWGAEVIPMGIVADRLDAVRERLQAARDADLIVTSGGVSLGDFDLVKDAMLAEGAVDIWQVRMKPGKPLAFGRVGGVPLLGLPGNPVAAAVSFEVFGRPAVRRMQGEADVSPPVLRATLTEALDNRGMRRHYVRAVVTRTAGGGWTARTAGTQGAGVLSSLSRANALLVVPESVERAEPGMVLDAIPLDRDDLEI